MSDGYLFSYLVFNSSLFPKSWHMEQICTQECLGGTNLIVCCSTSLNYIWFYQFWDPLHSHVILWALAMIKDIWRLWKTYNIFDGYSILVCISYKITKLVYITTGSYFQTPLWLPSSWLWMNKPKLYYVSEKVFLVTFPVLILTLDHRKTKLEWRSNN